MEKIKFKNKIKALSLFSNVGMAETYLEELGVEVVVANELLPERGMFYTHLYPKANMIVGDITSEDIFNKVISAAVEAGVEMVLATPPCQGMSCAGSKDPLDPRNFLIYYAVEAVKRIKPRIITPQKSHKSIIGNVENDKLFWCIMNKSVNFIY